MKLRKIFIYINLLILFLLMLTGCTSKGENWPRVTYWTFDNRIIDIDDNYILDDGNRGYRRMKRKPPTMITLIIKKYRKKY